MTRLRLAENFRAVFYAPFYAAVTLGHAKRQGLDVEFVASDGPGGGVAAMLDGAADITWGGPMRIMKVRNDPNGPPLVLFCEVVRRDPFYLVARNGIDRFALGDLMRQRFASVSEVPTPWLCLQHDLRDLGLDPAGVARIPDRTMADNIAALARGEIDVAQVFEPYAAMAERQGLGRIVHAQASRGDTSYTTLTATGDGVKRHAPEFAALTRAYAETLQWVVSHSGEDLAATVAPYFTHVDKADLVTALARYKAAGLWATEPAISRKGFDRLAVSLLSGGFIAKIPPFDDCVVDFPA
jgi:NitT/TauT family transport system substrate-binding protein